MGSRGVIFRNAGSGAKSQGWWSRDQYFVGHQATSGRPSRRRTREQSPPKDAFSDSLAYELAPRRIAVNVIAPGGVETKTLRALPGEVQGMLAQRTPLSIGKPGDIAEVAAFLASEAGAWITAAKYRVDGEIR